MIILCSLLFVAAIYDYIFKRIPNWLNAVILLIGILVRIINGEIGEVVRVVPYAVMFIIMAYPLFGMSALGAGDIKLFVACMPFINANKFIFFFFFSLLVAAIFSLIKIIKYKASYGKGSIKVCMGGPILIGALLHLGGVY